MAFKWTAQRRQAAALLADDFLSDKEIAQAVKAARSTLANWKTCEEFQAEIAAIAQVYREKAVTEGIAERAIRMRRLNGDYSKLRSIIFQRQQYWLQTAADCKAILESESRRKMSSDYLEAEAMVRQWDGREHEEGEKQPVEVRTARAFLVEKDDVIRARKMQTIIDHTPGIFTGDIARDVKSSMDVYVSDINLLAELRAMEIQAAKELGQWSEKYEDVTPLSDSELIERGQKALQRIGAAGVAGPP